MSIQICCFEIDCWEMTFSSRVLQSEAITIGLRSIRHTGQLQGRFMPPPATKSPTRSGMPRAGESCEINSRMADEPYADADPGRA